MSTETKADTAARVGDVVRVGKGRKLWRVESLWPGDDETLARLEPLDGYSHTSAELTRLTIVARDSK